VEYALDNRLSKTASDLIAEGDRAQRAEGDIRAELQEQLADVPFGTKVGPGLYEVHSRVLWDVGWMEPGSGDGHGQFVYNSISKALVYGYGRTLFLAPFLYYGVPDVQQGAVRRVRLYVNYAHHIGCAGTPTVAIGPVEFSLPVISGDMPDVGANWSDFKSADEFAGVVHTGISVYQKDWSASASRSWCVDPSQGMGVVTRIEAHYYDQF
jgi:hypothetical protein